MLRALCLLVLISYAPSASADEAGLVRIGAVELRYDQALWTVERAPDGEVARLVSMPDWRDTIEVAVEIVPAPDGRCDLAGERERLDRAIRWFDMHDENYSPISVAANGLEVFGVTASLGCRNWASHPLAACARAGDLVHRFTFLTDGCQSGPKSEERVLELLSGLRSAD
jgi:hypothetical protein